MMFIVDRASPHPANGWLNVLAPSGSHFERLFHQLDRSNFEKAGFSTGINRGKVHRTIAKKEKRICLSAYVDRSSEEVKDHRGQQKT